MGGKNVFVYWDGGFEAAPPIVRRCVETIREHTPEGWQLHLLSEENVHEYVAMPPFMSERVRSGQLLRAHYADALRTALLFLYGGLWIDATCYLTSPVPPLILNADLFLFSAKKNMATPHYFENWFIRAAKGNYVMERQLQNFLCYCQTARRPASIYFSYFDIMTSLYQHDAKAHDLLDAMIWWPAAETFLMTPLYTLGAPCSDELWTYLTSKCFIQKLTYKYSEDCARQEGNILSRVLGN